MTVRQPQRPIIHPTKGMARVIAARKAVNTNCADTAEASKYRIMSGMATLTMVEDAMVAKTPSIAAAHSPTSRRVRRRVWSGLVRSRQARGRRSPLRQGRSLPCAQGR